MHVTRKWSPWASPFALGWPSLSCGLPAPTLGLRSSLCVLLGDHVRGGLACVVLGSPNAGIGLVGVVLGVPSHI